MIKDEKDTKILEYSYILVPEEYYIDNSKGRDITKIVFYPSMDTYIANCTEDAFSQICFDVNSFLNIKDLTIEQFLDDIQYFITDYDNVGDYKYKYIGKTYKYDVENPHNTIKENIHIITTYLYFGHIIFSKEEFDYLEQMRKNDTNFLIEKIKEKFKNKSTNIEDIKKVLSLMGLIDEDGFLLELYSDLLINSNEKAKARTREKENK